MRASLAEYDFQSHVGHDLVEKRGRERDTGKCKRQEQHRKAVIPSSTWADKGNQVRSAVANMLKGGPLLTQAW